MRIIFNHGFTLSLLSILAIYLFATAPQTLALNSKRGELIPIQTALEILNQENQIIRELYTREIVGLGKKQGLKFDEHWQKEDVHAGLLPAQFLRATADYLQRSKMPIGLFLGSDQAINKANNLEGLQLTQFLKMKKDGQPKFSYINDIQRYSYMFPDIASVKPCVSCHNKHEESPKTDWKLDDVMGATTWIYPDESVTFDELMSMISILHEGANYAYKQVLIELSFYRSSYKFADKWPREGKYIPDEEAFANEIVRLTAPATFANIENIVNPKKTVIAGIELL